MWQLLILLGLLTFIVGLVLLFLPRRMARKWSGLMVVAGLMTIAAGGNSIPADARQRMADQRAERDAQKQDRKGIDPAQVDSLKRSVSDAIAAANLPTPESIEIANRNRLVVTFVVNDAALRQMVAAGVSSPEDFASKAILTVRNAAFPFKLVDAYRVTLNGPPPGPGLVLRYGSARLNEGSSVVWEPGPPR